MSEGVLSLIRPGDDLPESWDRSLLLHWNFGTHEGWVPWRDLVLGHLEQLGYRGVVFLAEPGTPHSGASQHLRQLEWLTRICRMSDVILSSWPADAHYPENLHWLLSSELLTLRKVVLQLDERTASLLNDLDIQSLRRIHLVHSERDAVVEVLRLLKDAAQRSGPERAIPLDIWRTAEFKNWYAAQQAVGNKLKNADAVWAFRPGLGYVEPLWYWAVHVGVHIHQEARTKVNEPVIGRPDIAATVLHSPVLSIEDTEVVLVREYRVPTTGADGYVWELPSGSGTADEDIVEIAIRECREEVGIDLEASRLRYHGKRQLLATMSCHQAYLFSAVLSSAELNWIQRNRAIARGVPPIERTFVELLTVREIFARGLLDWSMTGMLHLALSEIAR
jgi:8-oxo-dGTP pyrophosphatase MutT (NUDIX family)